MNLATSVRQAVSGSLAMHLPEPPGAHLVDTIAYDLVILAANRVEAVDSPLCDCGREINTPKNWRTGRILDHHCDCTAVVTASRLLDGVTSTLHMDQCTPCKAEAA